MRLIDADAIPWTDLNADIPNTKIKVLITFADKVNRMPTIEPRCEECENFSKTRLLIPQSETIRCKDCKRYDAHNHRCKWWNHGVSNIDWCSYAEPYKGKQK